MKFGQNDILWDLYAKCYNVLSELAPYREMQDRVLELAGPDRIARVLDAGCGTGNFLRLAEHTRRNWDLYGIDFSEKMLQVARRSTQAKLTRCNLNEPLDFSDGFFDIIVSTNVLYALENPKRAMMELRRILSNRGTIIIVTPANDCRLLEIILAHASKEGYFRMVSMLPRLLIVGVLNGVILRRSHIGKYRFFNHGELEELFYSAKISRVYAGQAWMIQEGASDRIISRANCP